MDRPAEHVDALEANQGMDLQRRVAGQPSSAFLEPLLKLARETDPVQLFVTLAFITTIRFGKLGATLALTPAVREHLAFHLIPLLLLRSGPVNDKA